MFKVLAVILGLLPTSLALRTLYVVFKVEIDGLTPNELYEKVNYWDEPKWYPGIVSLKQLKEGYDGETGAVYEQHAQFNGLPLRNIIEVIEAKPGEYKRFIGKGMMWYTTAYTFEATEGGARMTNIATLNGYFLPVNYLRKYVEEACQGLIQFAGKGQGRYEISEVRRIR